MSGDNPYQWQQGPQPQQPGYPPQQGYPQQPSVNYPAGGYTPYGSSQVPPPSQTVPGVLNLPPEAFGGFWIRFAALFVDWLVLVVPNLAISAAIMLAFGYEPLMQFDFERAMNSSQDGRYQLANNLSSGVTTVLTWLYFAFMHSGKGASLGKLALGLRVVDQYGMYVGFGRATGRYFATILSACLCAVGYIMAGFHQQKRSLHDMIAGTWVVRAQYVNPAQLQMMQRY